MVQRSRETFQETLLAVAPRNAQALETKALTASSLAVTYPQCEGTLRTIESAAIEQMLRILVHMPSIRDAWAPVGERPDRELAGAMVAAD